MIWLYAVNIGYGGGRESIRWGGGEMCVSATKTVIHVRLYVLNKDS